MTVEQILTACTRAGVELAPRIDDNGQPGFNANPKPKVTPSLRVMLREHKWMLTFHLWDIDRRDAHERAEAMKTTRGFPNDASDAAVDAAEGLDKLCLIAELNVPAQMTQEALAA